MSSQNYDREYNFSNNRFQNFLCTLGTNLKVSPNILERVKRESTFENSFRMIFCSYAGMDDHAVFSIWGKDPNEIQTALNGFFKKKFTVSDSVMQDVEKMRKIVKESVEDVGTIKKKIEDTVKPALQEKDEVHVKLVNSLDKQIAMLEKEKEELRKEIDRLNKENESLIEELNLSKVKLEDQATNAPVDDSLKREEAQSPFLRFKNLIFDKKAEKIQQKESLEVSDFIEKYLLNEDKPPLNNSQIDFILNAYKSGESIEDLKKVCNSKLTPEQMKNLLLLYKGRAKRR